MAGLGWERYGNFHYRHDARNPWRRDYRIRLILPVNLAGRKHLSRPARVRQFRRNSSPIAAALELLQPDSPTNVPRYLADPSDYA